MNSAEYKALSLKEFDMAAAKFDDNDPSVYNMCRKDYPDVALKEISRVLKKGGILFAPTFVYEEGYSKLFIWLMERAGFKTYHKWSRTEYVKYVSQRGLKVIGDTLIKAHPLSECVLVARKE